MKDALISLAWAGTLGALGQASRAVLAISRNSEQIIGTQRLLISLATGAVVAMGLSIGLHVTWETANTFYLFGYVGADALEKRS